ncbi:MarC family protein [Oryzisolibacter sp. LB2S]|uniref:MarC family protein n=1 Tax=Alicycliphilus soli TaxID=3228789 RepID=UPI00345867DA
MDLPLPHLLLAFGKSLLFTLAGVLPIINPLATAPVFVDLTRGMSDGGRAALARRIGKNIALLLAGAMLSGSYLLDFFGVSLPVVRVAGGMIVASIAWRMLNAQQSTSEDTTQMAQSLSEDRVRIKAFYPLTFPLTCGPGSIAVAIAVGASLHSRRSVTETMVNIAGGLVGAVLLGMLVALTFRYANRVLQRLGETGQIVFLRLMAFMLLCVGVEIIWSGARVLILGVMNAG